MIIKYCVKYFYVIVKCITENIVVSGSHLVKENNIGKEFTLQIYQLRYLITINIYIVYLHQKELLI